nr:ubiquitin carboxyl-terminal hydrolase MINDY-2-like [Aegilops tauschii subsp. strangulata]
MRRQVPARTVTVARGGEGRRRTTPGASEPPPAGKLVRQLVEGAPGGSRGGGEAHGGRWRPQRLRMDEGGAGRSSRAGRLGGPDPVSPDQQKAAAAGVGARRRQQRPRMEGGGASQSRAGRPSRRAGSASPDQQEAAAAGSGMRREEKGWGFPGARGGGSAPPPPSWSPAWLRRPALWRRRSGDGG